MAPALADKSLIRLDRATVDGRRDAAPGIAILGFLDLRDRRSGLPDHWIAGAHVDGPDWRLPIVGIDLSALIVSTVAILAHFVWTYPAAYLLTRLGSRTRRADPVPPRQRVFAVSFTGVRGIVSLAAALGLPLAVPVAHHFRIAI
jgi:hypothetical protein